MEGAFAAFVPGTQLGRFVVTGVLGEGGMGVVYAATDPTLDRQVAIKVLRGAPSDEARARLLREAQALARLSDEHVVPVYEAGEIAGEIYLVMEYVSGSTLTRWLEEAPRRWQEIVDVFVRAGRGLAAAHAAGVVHRDFKPDNVLVGTDDRVRVTDFGVAAAAGGAEELSGAVGGNLLALTLTRSGTTLGTPAFMAPEQHEGKIDPRTDQFAFGVALYFALVGRLPFAGEVTMEYLGHVVAGEVRPPPREARAPARLWRLIDRALRPAPEERYADMRALLADLEATRHHGTAPRVLLAATVGAALLASVTFWVSRRVNAPGPCADASAHLADVWNDETRGRVGGAIERRGSQGAKALAQAVTAQLDGRARAWAAMRQETCEATLVRHTQSAAILDLRSACLEGILEETRALVGLLSHGDPAVTAHALQSVDELTAVEQCADERRLKLRYTAAEDPVTRREIAAVRKQLAEARAVAISGRAIESRRLAEEAHRHALATGDAPLIAEALYRRALFESDPVRARALALETIERAAGLGDDELVSDAWAVIAEACDTSSDPGCDRATPIRMARAALSGRPHDDEREAWLLDLESRQAATKGDMKGAVALLERSLALAIRGNGPDSHEAARAHGNLARMLALSGEDPGVHAERALAIYRQLGGPDNPAQAVTLEVLAVHAVQQQRWDDGVRWFEQALQLHRTIDGRDSEEVAACYGNLALLFVTKEDFARAIPPTKAAIEILERIPTEGPRLGRSLAMLGYVYDRLDRREDARHAYERTLQVRERTYGPKHEDVAEALRLLGDLLRREGRFPEAIAALERALAISEELGQGRNQDAAATRFNLARALWGRDQPRDRARSDLLAREAHAIYVEAKEPNAELEAWLRKMGGGGERRARR